MATTDKSLNDFIVEKVTRLLGITEKRYNELIFNAGIKANENNSKYKSYFVNTGAYWDCFGHRVSYFNLLLIVEDQFEQSLPNGEPVNISISDYFKLITQKFELPKRTINLINKQYRIDFENSQIIKKGDLKSLNQRRRTRTPRKVNNQTEINLNTI